MLTGCRDNQTRNLPFTSPIVQHRITATNCSTRNKSLRGDNVALSSVVQKKAPVALNWKSNKRVTSVPAVDAGNRLMTDFRWAVRCA